MVLRFYRYNYIPINIATETIIILVEYLSCQGSQIRSLVLTCENFLLFFQKKFTSNEFPYERVLVTSAQCIPI